MRLSAAALEPATAPPAELPVTVAVGLYYVDFDSIDLANQNFRAMGYMSLRWKDPRLAFDPSAEGTDQKSYAKDAIWHPVVEVVNSQEQQITLEDEFMVLPDGTVSQYSRFVDVLDSEFDLRRFPFDTQSLLCVIESFRYDARIVRFVEDQQRTGLSADAFLAEWTFTKIAAKSTVSWFPPDQTEFSRLTFTIDAERKWGYYLWKVILPLVLTVVISWCTFWIGDRETELGMSVTLVLTMVAFSITLDFSLPKVPYLTWMDKFAFLCFATVFLVAMENVMVNNVQRDRSALAQAIRSRSRWVFPLAFCALSALIFVW